jgi:UDP-N-acetylglucosamine diphosphorylase/glucosamine-1-phosphate N-acetyltransferase
LIVLFFEDPFHGNFEPLSISHPVYTFLCGTSRLYQKWLSAFEFDNYGFISRPFLADILRLETGKPVNMIPEGDFLLINGRVLPSPDLLTKLNDLRHGQALVCDELLIAYRAENGVNNTIKESLLNIHTTGAHEKIKSITRVKKIELKYPNHIWDFIGMNEQMISREFARFKKESKITKNLYAASSIINPEQIFMDGSSKIGASVVIDASEGPVIIDQNTKVEPFSLIQGPCYIGPDCRIVGGRIRSGTSLGPVCRVGGEVEESIMMGYCNKYHEGFLGHAYLGEWVNLGALTTNSDLKNNYKEISVQIGNTSVNTGSIKIGCFIGDHTKTGIGTMLNTGINIGFSCNLYGAGLFAEKLISSFNWGTPGNLVKYKIEKAAQTAAISMERRGVKFTDIHDKLFEYINKNN